MRYTNLLKQAGIIDTAGLLGRMSLGGVDLARKYGKKSLGAAFIAGATPAALSRLGIISKHYGDNPIEAYKALGKATSRGGRLLAGKLSRKKTPLQRMGITKKHLAVGGAGAGLGYLLSKRDNSHKVNVQQTYEAPQYYR